MKIYQGIVASAGIVKGNAFVFARSEQHTVPMMKIAESEREPGWNRFEKSISEITEYYENLIDAKSKEQNAVIETYLMMLSDADFIKNIKTQYKSESWNIEHIIKMAVDSCANTLRSTGDEYLNERAQDIEDVFEKVLFNMLGYSQVGVDYVTEGSIVIAEKLSPSEAMTLFKKNIKALVTKEGGVSSHISILARTYGVPSIFGIDNLCSEVEQDKLVIVDAEKGIVIVDPEKVISVDYDKKIKDAEKKKLELLSFLKKKGQTKDGTPIKIYANIASVEDAKIAKDEEADGIGLFRTEFMFMDSENGKLPTEEEQYKVYSEVLKLMGDKPVTIRTLDAGGDKIVTGLHYDEKNPLLGCRAIRICLKQKDLFKTQLKALYRSSVHGNLRIILPMITSYEQLNQTKAIIEEIKKELTNEGIGFAAEIPLGVMIETPAAAICSDLLAKKSDFFSIGSNDLTQYVLAVDRENTQVFDLYDELHPAVQRMIRHTVESSERAKIELSVCGEMASREETLKVLVGLGIRHLSVTPNAIAEVKKILSKNTVPEMENIVKDFI